MPICRKALGDGVIQLFLREKDAFQRFTRLNQDYLAKPLSDQGLRFFLPLIEVMNATALALIIWYGGSEILRGR